MEILKQNKNILRTFYINYVAGGNTIQLNLQDNIPKKIKTQIYFENIQGLAGNSIVRFDAQLFSVNGNNLYGIKGDSTASPYNIIYEFTNNNIINNTQLIKIFLTSNNTEITQGFYILILNFIY